VRLPNIGSEQRTNKGPSAGPPRLGQKGIAPITVGCFRPGSTELGSGSAAAVLKLRRNRL